MLAPKRITAFTLVEVLIVLVIFGMMMVLSGGMSRRARDTFVAQQYVKSSVQNARILRRKSMLITRNSGESDVWVQGIGFRIEKDTDTNQWVMTQIKALSTVTSNNYFYQSFPGGTPCLELTQSVLPPNAAPVTCSPGPNVLQLEKLANTTQQKLPDGMEFGITTGAKAPAPASCARAITVIYESINGTLHAYCKGTSGIDTSLGKSGDTIDLKLRINYSNGGSYQYYLNLKNNGEINAVKN